LRNVKEICVFGTDFIASTVRKTLKRIYSSVKEMKFLVL